LTVIEFDIKLRLFGAKIKSRK